MCFRFIMPKVQNNLGNFDSVEEAFHFPRNTLPNFLLGLSYFLSFVSKNLRTKSHSSLSREPSLNSLWRSTELLSSGPQRLSYIWLIVTWSISVFRCGRHLMLCIICLDTVSIAMVMGLNFPALNKWFFPFKSLISSLIPCNRFSSVRCSTCWGKLPGSCTTAVKCRRQISDGLLSSITYYLPIDIKAKWLGLFVPNI